MDPLFPTLPEDLAALTADELSALIDEFHTQIQAVTGDPASYVGADRDADGLFDETSAAVDALAALRAEATSRETPEPEPEPEPEEEAEAAAAEAEALAARMAELAARAAETPDPEPEPEPEPEPAPEAAAVVVVAAAEPPPARRALPRPSRTHAPVPVEPQSVPMVASAGADGVPMGHVFRDMEEIGQAMARRRRQFGHVAEGASENIGIARSDWSDLYPAERRLDMSEERNMQLIAAATRPEDALRELDKRRSQGLVASGGLCAPVTPYYQLQMISVADRPVRASLPAFNADRGGIRFAAPAALSAVSTGVGVKTVANDFAGGTEATKTCQVVACPGFTEADVEIIWHCIQFGNLGARVFPELLAQWNNLVLAAHARKAESEILTAIGTASTAVTAGSLGMGASSALFPQLLTAASGLRSRHRMRPDTVLRLLMPRWATALIVSDVIRGQFQRFDTDEDRVVALLRSFNIEPTFYIDGATGKSQVYGTQAAGSLLGFPATVVSYLFPEGSFLYLDGGVLELGLVRDSVLNATNDFQIFGESFEYAAFVGVESLQLTSTTCDSGVVSLPTVLSGTCGTY